MGQNRFGIYPASFVHAGGTLVLPQITSDSLRPQSNLTVIRPSGLVDNMAAVVNFAEPMIELTTFDLGTFFTTVSPITGLYCTSGASIFGQKRTIGGTFAGAGAHALWSSTLGFLYPDSLTCRQDSPAELNVRYVPLYDGTNQPLRADAAQSLTGTPSFQSVFYLGPAYTDVDATETAMPELRELRINFGIDFRVTRTDGEVWPSMGAIYARDPTIDMTFFKADLADKDGGGEGGLTSLFGEGWTGNMGLYLFRGANKGIRAADGTHAKFTVYSGIRPADAISVTGEDDYTITLRITPLYDGSNAVLAATVAGTLPI